MEYALNLPLNAVSFGNVSIAILREVYSRGEEPCLFPIGQIDLSSQKPDEKFNNWLNICLNKANSHHKRSVPTFKLWHIQDSLSSFSDKQTLLSFYETDSPTADEVNILKNQRKVLFTSNYTVDIFKQYGLTNVEFAPLAFDSYNFKDTNKPYLQDRITFSLAAKLEPARKSHATVLRSWAKKYGNNPNYFLNCAVFNPFIKPEDQQRILNDILGGVRYFNIQFLGFMPTNELYNDFLCSNNIIIGMGNESWDLPAFHSVALGKHAVILNCNGYKGWANEENAILVPPNSKIEAHDGIFFHKGHRFNQGNFFNFAPDAFIEGCEKAIERVKKDRINHAGLKLQEQFTIKKTVDAIFEHLK